MDKISKAIEFMSQKHAGQLRKDNTPYVWHPIKVAQYLINMGEKREEVIISALLHDVIEDTDATPSEIKELFGDEVLRLVLLLTKSKDKTTKEYINCILADEAAKLIKNADRIDNLRDSRNADMKFCENYLINTKRYFRGKFSEELDSLILDIEEHIITDE